MNQKTYTKEERKAIKMMYTLYKLYLVMYLWTMLVACVFVNKPHLWASTACAGILLSLPVLVDLYPWSTRRHIDALRKKVKREIIVCEGAWAFIADNYGDPTTVIEFSRALDRIGTGMDRLDKWADRPVLRKLSRGRTLRTVIHSYMLYSKTKAEALKDVLKDQRTTRSA